MTRGEIHRWLCSTLQRRSFHEGFWKHVTRSRDRAGRVRRPLAGMVHGAMQKHLENNAIHRSVCVGTIGRIGCWQVSGVKCTVSSKSSTLAFDIWMLLTSALHNAQALNINHRCDIKQPLYPGGYSTNVQPRCKCVRCIQSNTTQ